MAEADWHLKDLLSFYVSKCRSELVGVSEDPVRAETMFDAVRRVREIMILMSCMVGAFTPSEIGALHRLDQIRLVAENEASQMLRIGEDMALLRLWLKSAVDCQWSVGDAVRILRTGRLTNTSAFPEMTIDLLTSVKKPFIVPSGLPSNSESIRRTLRASILTQFSRAKQNPPYIPTRVEMSFSPEDDSVIITAKNEFRLKGIYDHRRWTVIEAQILDDVSGAFKCRQILQALSSASIDEMCTALLRMATAQKLKIFQDEAVALSGNLQASAWSSVYSVSKSKAGLGNGFTVHLFKRLSELDISACFDMKPENGDFIVKVHCSGVESPDLSPSNTYESTFPVILRDIEERVDYLVLGTILPDLLGMTYRCAFQQSCCASFLHLPDHCAIITITASGCLSIISSSTMLQNSLVLPLSLADGSKLKQTIDVFALIQRIYSVVRAKLDEGWVHCAKPSLNEMEIDVVHDMEELFAIARSTIESNPDWQFVCAFKRAADLEVMRFKFE